MIVVDGKWFKGGGASFEQVKVKLYASGILYFTSDNGDVQSTKRDELVVSDKIGSIPRELVFPDKSLMIVPSDTLVDDWLGHTSKRISRWEQSPKAVMLSIIAVPLALYFIFAVAVPSLAVVFAPFVPDAVVEMSSDHTLKTLESTVLNESEADSKKTAKLRQQWRELIAQMDLAHSNYKILFKNSETMGANAFALPNGTIVFTDQLLELVEFDEDILTAIFMHEIGHVEQHHSMRLVSQTIVSSIAINYFIGDVGAFFDIFASAGNTIATNQFTQKLEWEADNFALQQLQATGKDPVDFARGMQKFSELSEHNTNELEQLFSSHPLTDDRIYNALKFAGLPKEYRDELVLPANQNKEANIEQAPKLDTKSKGTTSAKETH